MTELAKAVKIVLDDLSGQRDYCPVCEWWRSLRTEEGRKTNKETGAFRFLPYLESGMRERREAAAKGDDDSSSHPPLRDACREYWGWTGKVNSFEVCLTGSLLDTIHFHPHWFCSVGTT